MHNRRVHPLGWGGGLLVKGETKLRALLHRERWLLLPLLGVLLLALALLLATGGLGGIRAVDYAVF